jgi:hypothetical protein
MAHVLLPLAGLQLDSWRERQKLQRRKVMAVAELGLRKDLDPTGDAAREACRLALRYLRAGGNPEDAA